MSTTLYTYTAETRKPDELAALLAELSEDFVIIMGNLAWHDHDPASGAGIPPSFLLPYSKEAFHKMVELEECLIAGPDLQARIARDESGRFRLSAISEKSCEPGPGSNWKKSEVSVFRDDSNKHYPIQSENTFPYAKKNDSFVHLEQWGAKWKLINYSIDGVTIDWRISPQTSGGTS